MIYSPPTWGATAMVPLMFIAVVLFGAANAPSTVKQYIRHPMLLGMALWGIAHLIGDGDDRSVVLFGGMTIWAFLMQTLINRRDGAYEKPPAAPMAANVRLLIISAVIYVAFVFVHPWIAGVSAL